MKKVKEAHVPIIQAGPENKKWAGDSDPSDDHGRFRVHEAGQP